MRIQPFRAYVPKIDTIGVSPAHFTRHIRDTFSEMLAKGVFQTLPEEGFLVCQIQTPVQQHTGCITLTDINDFLEGKIRKHEGILPEKEAHHKAMTLDRNGMIKPVLLAHWKNGRLAKALKTVMSERNADFSFAFPEEGQVHRFWQIIAPETIEKLVALFHNIGYCFIADGHHRAASTAALYQETGDMRYKYLLSAYFSTEELTIHAYHRIFKYPHNDTRHFEFLRSICHLTPIHSPILPQSRHSMTIFYRNQWYKMCWKLPTLSLPYTDIAILNDYFFPNCPDFDAKKQLEYTEGIQSIEKIIAHAKQSPNAIVFFLPPFKFRDIKTIFEMETIFPAKSTWFEPRIKSGLVTYLLDSRL